jgi:hypothetical protein
MTVVPSSVLIVFVQLGGAGVELLLKLRIAALKFNDHLVLRCGHWLPPSGRASSRSTVGICPVQIIRVVAIFSPGWRAPLRVECQRMGTLGADRLCSKARGIGTECVLPVPGHMAAEPILHIRTENCTSRTVKRFMSLSRPYDPI